ncbi:unnamed protein product [Somion occarium]|uniref:Uncharacterized protein n=1 Tax=Somion occarium TaxID=3059160 RepID=A0ABP1DA94_9APHY
METDSYHHFGRRLHNHSELDSIGPARIHYEPPASPSDYDLVRSLVPAFSHEDPKSTNFLANVDPRLWAVIIQTVSPLPEAFRTYTLPLSDIHAPLLQQIPSTPDFALLTVLELRGREEVDDQTVVQLGDLHNLAAVDLSLTVLTSWGIKTLSKTLLTSEDTGKRRGPWGLRIIHLRDCMKIDDSIFDCLPKFPLLSVADLRGTRCRPSTVSSSPFRPSGGQDLFHPTPLTDSLIALTSHSSQRAPGLSSSLFSHPDPYFLRLSTLHHRPPARSTPYRGLRMSLGSLSTFSPLPLSGIDTISDIDDDEYHYDPAGVVGDRHSLTEDSKMQDVVAAEESRGHNARRALAAFYAPLPPTSKACLITYNSKSAHAAASSSEASRSRIAPPHPLMLFRSPPPYSLIQNSSSEDPGTIAVSRSMKRPRTEDALHVLHGDKARQSNKAKEGIQAVWDLVNKKPTAETSGHHGHSRVAEVRNNPFARKSQLQSRASFPFDIDPDLLATAERDRAKTYGSRMSGAMKRSPKKPSAASASADGEGKKATTKLNRKPTLAAARPPSCALPSLDPDLLASVQADRQKDMELQRQKEEKARNRTSRKRKRSKKKDLSYSDSDSGHSDSDEGEFNDIPSSPNLPKGTNIRIPKETGPPPKMKPLTAHPIPYLPPDLRPKGYTEADKAKLLGIKLKRRKSEGSDGLRQMTLSHFASKPSTSAGSSRPGPISHSKKAPRGRPRPSV